MTFATVIKRRLGVSAVVALGLASISSGLLGAVPAAAAAAHPPASRLDSDNIRTTRIPLVPGPSRTTPRAASPRAASVTCDSQFHQVPGANPGTAVNFIQNNGLAAISPTDVWAVGARADFTSPTTIGNDAPMVERWDGFSWTSIPVDNPSMPPTPGNPGGYANLNGVASVPGVTTAANNVFAVGIVTYYGVDPLHPLAEVYTGTGSTGWNVVTPANVGTGDNFLFGVTAIAANNVWAVGSWQQDNNTGTPRRTLIAHWDGTGPNFTTVASPDPTPTSSDRLLAAGASGANDVWAVGRSIVGGVRRTLILHYDGTGWTIIPSPNPSPTSNTLYGVTALSPTLAYAVGNWIDAGGYSHPLVAKWNGAAWSTITVPSPSAPNKDNVLFSVSALSANDVWVAGASYAPTAMATPGDTVVEHWDGSTWRILPTPNGADGNFNELNAIVAIAPSSVWAAGDYISSAQTELTLFENLCPGLPTVTGVLPISGNVYGGTTVTISGTDFNFATGVKFGATAASSFTINSNTQITATTPSLAVAGTVDVTVTSGAGTSATSPADTYVYVPRAISWQQYSLAGSDGATWQPIDANNLAVAFQPSVDSMAILSGNADLWTSLPGVNQDIGLVVIGMEYGSGTLVGWKESGGYAGTFSPNAAFVQAVIPVTRAGLYGVQLVWKANKATSGTIFAAAGAGPNYSPSRLTAELVPTTSMNLSPATNKQYHLTGSNGSTWQDLDATNLVIAKYTPSASGSALISANADLWTATAGVNQDLGIFVSGGSYGAGQVVGWKESGGFAGTFSPNAAYAQSVIQLTTGVQYTIKLQWKSNKNTAGTIFAGAGAGPVYSPTRLTLRLFPGGTGLQDAMTNLQYNKVGGTGADWTPIDGTGLKLTVNPAANSSWVLSANADLWTSTVGINQDLGIFISGGAYGSGTLVAWKESGGYGGTFSPNAAFVQTVIPLATGTTYTITLEWKANRPTGGTIYAAAGGGPVYSPTRLTAQLLS